MKRWQDIIIVPFVIIELAILLLVCFGVFHTQTINFIAIVICFTFSLIFISKKLGVIAIQVGLLFTVISDIFLVLLDARHNDVAMTTFSITQIMYCMLLLLHVPQKRKIIDSGIRVVVVIAVEVVTYCVLKEKFDYLSFISMFYYANIILNFIFACVSFNKNPYMAIGLFFFILCDTVIGLKVANGSYINLEVGSFWYKIVSSNFNFAWLFYIPAQTLIAISAKFEKEKGAVAP